MREIISIVNYNNHMKRKLTIITIIILLIAIIAGGAWFLVRNRATKNNTTPPTFKEFLGIGVSTKPGVGGTTDNPLSSDFVNPPDEVPTTTGTNPIPVGTSVFTDSDGASQPGLGLGLGTGGLGLGLGTGSGGLGSGGGGSGGTGSGGGSTGGGGGTGSGGGGGVVINPPPADPNPPECGPADLSINFTPEEINKLNALKTRFFVVAETLNTDADVATEIANYDTFKTKSRKITELKNYCMDSLVYKNAQATAVATQPYGTVVPGTNGDINYRVPTPFWHDNAKDNQALVHQGSNWMGIFSDPDFIFPERSIEHALRLNLW